MAATHVRHLGDVVALRHQQHTVLTVIIKLMYDAMDTTHRPTRSVLDTPAVRLHSLEAGVHIMSMFGDTASSLTGIGPHP